MLERIFGRNYTSDSIFNIIDEDGNGMVNIENQNSLNKKIKTFNNANNS